VVPRRGPISEVPNVSFNSVHFADATGDDEYEALVRAVAAMEG
jgi:hypothetical protein